MATNHSHADPPSSSASSLLLGSQPADRGHGNSHLEDLTRIPGYVPSFSIAYVGHPLNDSQDPAFPLLLSAKRPDVRRRVRVSEAVFDMTPRTLLTYKLLSNGIAKYTPYSLPDGGSRDAGNVVPSSTIKNWLDVRESPHLLTPPIITTSYQQLPCLPQEMFDQIASYLSQDDFKALRLTSRGMCDLATNGLFKAIVVPFTPGVFSKELRTEMDTHKGKGKAKSTAVNIFKSYGAHMRAFGISYEVDEARLAFLPRTRQHAIMESYWGTYDWPYDLNRYKNMPASGLGDISGMRDALSEMTNLNELAISIDSGLGWLPGPDKTIRSQMVHKKIDLFPGAHGLPSKSAQVQLELWEYIKSQYLVRSRLPELLQSRLYRLRRIGFPAEDCAGSYSGIPNELQYVDRRTLMEATAPGSQPAESCPRDGYLVTARDAGHISRRSRYPVLPSSLTQEQIEMLMKTRWAQDSLADAYIMGVIDSETCRAVKILNLACLPGRIVTSFNRTDFWEALPCLETITLMVMGEMRALKHGTFGEAEYDPVPLSSAVPHFKSLLRDQIARRPSIKNLNMGWASGGEHAVGVLGRNRHLLPAPFIDHDSQPSTTMMDDILAFPHIQHLTIMNSWMSSNALEDLVATHQQLKLVKLTLNSVSLQVLPKALGGEMPTVTASIRLPDAGPERPPVDWPYQAWSWPQVLDVVSPGVHFGLLGKATRNVVKPGSSLEEIEIISCGYSALEFNGWGLDDLNAQFVDAVNRRANTRAMVARAAYFRARRLVLEPLMLMVPDTWLAYVVQHIPQTESHALQSIWGATMGWPDIPDAYAKDGDPIAVALDGQQLGGTGRFSVVVRTTGH